MPTYHPVRALVASALPVVCLLLIAWDRQWLASGQPAGWLSDRLARSGFDWSASLVSRLAGDAFSLSMAAALIVLVLYGVGQWLAGRSEGRALAGAKGGRGRLFRLVAGRGLADALSGAIDGKRLGTHFTYGRQSLMSPLRFAQWGFPVVGFIGTVIGVSDAVRQLPRAIRGGRIEESSLNSVLDGLHVAFDTTFVGLVAAVVTTLVIYALDGIWDRNELAAERRLAEADNGQASETGKASAEPDGRPPARAAATRA